MRGVPRQNAVGPFFILNSEKSERKGINICQRAEIMRATRKGNTKTQPTKHDQLGRFARAFKNERELQERIADLLRKMNRERVRITHGPMEHGRDIVFYGPNGLDGQSLYACVIKNSPITGEAGSCDSVRTVSDQAKEAFQHPYTNPDSGREEQVRVVWVMSPYECTPIAVESISSQLRGIGSVEFCCGASLLDLFAKHLQLFLLESNVLASYLSALRTGLQTDTALLRIILQKTILADVPMDFGAMYVPQNFAQTLRQVSVEDDLHVTIALKEQNIRQEDVRKLEGRLNRLQRLIDYLADANKMQLADLAPGIAPQEVFGSLILEVRDEWTQAYKAATGRPLACIHADVQWSGPWRQQLPELKSRLHAAGIQLGIMYNGDGKAQSGVEWTRQSQERFHMVEQGARLIPDQALLQSWTRQPDHMLPENREGTLTNLVLVYANR